MDIASWTGKVKPGVGALRCGEGWMDDVKRGTYKLTDAEGEEIFDVRKVDEEDSVGEGPDVCVFAMEERGE
jgi:hypothetical protein